MMQEKLREWQRVFQLSRKPRRDEFLTIAKITGLGIIVIGTVGFLIRMIVQALSYL